MQPSFETLRELVRACGFDLETRWFPYEVDASTIAAAEDAAALTAGAPAGDAEGAPLMPDACFDPIAVLQALDDPASPTS